MKKFMFYFLKQVLQNVLSSMGLSRIFLYIFMIKKKKKKNVMQWAEKTDLDLY